MIFVINTRATMPDNYSVNDQRISLFLRKLWTLVNSPQTDNVIIWNEVNLQLFNIIIKPIVFNVIVIAQIK